MGHAEGQPEGWRGAAEATEARRAAEATVCLVEGMIVVCRGMRMGKEGEGEGLGGQEDLYGRTTFRTLASGRGERLEV